MIPSESVARWPLLLGLVQRESFLPRPVGFAPDVGPGASGAER